MELKFFNSGKKLTDADIKKVESKLSTSFPESLKSLYLSANGGDPHGIAYWLNPEKSEPSKIELHRFIPLVQHKSFFPHPKIALEEWEEETLPSNLVPFAFDSDFNYYVCFDRVSGVIYYYKRIEEYDDSVNITENWRRIAAKNNAIQIADNFDSFMENVIFEFNADAEEEYFGPVEPKNYKKLKTSSLLKKIAKAILEIAEEEDNEEVLDGLKAYKKIRGASPEDLEEFERQVGVTLPDDFKELYLCKNGSGYPFSLIYASNTDLAMPFNLLSLDEIRETRQHFCNEDKLMRDMPDYFKEADIEELDPRIQPYISNTHWIPFATLVGGSVYLMLDFAPSPQGAEGQVIIYVHDPDFIYFLAANTRQLLEDTLNNLQEGEIDEL